MRLLLFLAFGACLFGQHPQAASRTAPKIDPRAVQQKIDIIQTGHAPPGAIYTFTLAELNAWARWKVPQIVPEGVRSPRLELTAGAAKGFALIDFVATRKGQGQTTNWLVAKLIEGEKPVTVNARIESGHGKAIAHLTRVEIGGIVVTGAPLDFLIETFFQPLFPDAKIDEWFDLPGKLDRLEIFPSYVRAIVRRK